jgi:hypothetical protein
MKAIKVVITLGYFLLFVWWSGIQIIAFPTATSLNVFAFVSGAYVILSSILVLKRMNRTEMYVKGGLEFVLLGLILFGLLGFVWRQPTTAVFSEYVYLFVEGLQFCPFFCMLLGLLRLSEDGENITIVFAKAVVLVSILVMFVLLASGAVYQGFFDLARFLIFFLPLQYVCLIAVSLIVLMHRYYDEGSVRWFGLICLGYAVFLAATLLFLYDFLVVAPFSPGAELFLRLTGSFMLLVGISSVPGSYETLFLGKHTGVTYFRNMSYKIPVGLN